MLYPLRPTNSAQTEGEITMKELLYNLIGLKQYIKQYHWLAKGYDNHILADKLEDGLEEQIDELAELGLASFSEDADFYAKDLLAGANTMIENSYTGTDMNETLKAIAGLFGNVLTLSKQTQDELKEHLTGQNIADLAFSDYLGRLSNSALVKLYLIQIQLNK